MRRCESCKGTACLLLWLLLRPGCSEEVTRLLLLLRLLLRLRRSKPRKWTAGWLLRLLLCVALPEKPSTLLLLLVSRLRAKGRLRGALKHAALLLIARAVATIEIERQSVR